MAYFPDLSEYAYSMYDERAFGRLPILNVGWMEQPHPLPTGAVPAGFREKLTTFCARERLVHLTQGVQACDLCTGPLVGSRRPFGNGEIRVLGKGVVYAAPTLIGHYVAAHGYRPPGEFIQAVLEGPGPDAREHVRYRFHCQEAVISHYWRQVYPEWWARTRPCMAPGSVLGPLIIRMRLLSFVVPFGVALILMAAYVRPWLALGLLLMLAAVFALLRRDLTCPICRARMAWPFREPRGWSRPPRSAWEHPFGTVLCDDCDFALRDTGDLWQATGDVLGR